MERVPWIGLSVVAIGLALALPALSFDAERIRLETLYYIHGVEVSWAAPTRLYLATHRGLFLASPDGTATKVSIASNNLTGFVVHPKSSQTFYASGHLPSGGNLGVLRSDDGGKSWSRLSEGANGPVDFHAMDVGKVNPDIIYGTNGGLQVSRDGGQSWMRQGPLPGQVFDLAASSLDPDTVYAATRDGLVQSTNAGKTWRPAHVLRRPATMVHATADGILYAFVAEEGLIKATEPSLTWATVSNSFGNDVLLHLAVDPSNADRLFAATNVGTLVASTDGGRTWSPFVGNNDTPPRSE